MELSKKVSAAVLAASILTTGAATYISNWEQGSKVETVVYRDEIGTGKPLTVCAGLTQATVGIRLQLGQRFTEDECVQLEGIVIQKEAKQVASLVKVEVTPNQMVALVDFVHNLGAGALAKSKLLWYLNHNQCQLAANEFNNSPQIDKNGHTKIYSGKTMIDKSTGKVLLKNGDTIKKYTTASGKPVKGLIIRRNSNRKLFESGCYAEYH